MPKPRDTTDDRTSTVDPRITAFMKPSIAFAAVEHAASVFKHDPFDVEAIHAGTRRVFQAMVEQSRSLKDYDRGSRFLLVLGDSGTGKTHLMRSFRGYVHNAGGYLVYAELNSESGSYARYLLRQLIASLQEPYAPPSNLETGLRELALGMAEKCGEAIKAEVANLAKGKWKATSPNDSLDSYIGGLGSRLQQQGGLSKHDTDLIRVLLYALLPDDYMTACVYRYLRCEKLTDSDSRQLGGVASRLDAGDPMVMISSLARLAYATQQAPFVFVIDQVELSGSAAPTSDELSRAVDTLDKIVTNVASVTAVIASLSNFYDMVGGKLNQAALDRLEKDPPIQKLSANRSHEEIIQIVSRRLEWHFGLHGATYQHEDPTYPFSADQLKQLVGRSTRGVLDWCHDYQTRRGIEEIIVNAPPAPTESPAYSWQQLLQTSFDKQLDDGSLVAALSEAARALAEENEIAVDASISSSGLLRVHLTKAKQKVSVIIAVTNKGYHHGAVIKQLASLQKAADYFAPVAVRTTDFPRGVACSKALDEFNSSGGRGVALDDASQQALIALQSFKPISPAAHVLAWRRRERPISTLPQIREIFSLAALGV